MKTAEKTVLVLLPLSDAQKQSLEEVLPARYVYRTIATATKEEAHAAHVIIGNIKPDFIKEAPHLELLQLNSAGTDGYLTPGVLPQGAVLTNATGAYGLALAEYLLAGTFALLKKFPGYARNQRAHDWHDLGAVTAIAGSQVLVVGLGDIGLTYAKKMSALGAHVTGIRRVLRPAPEGVEAVATLADLKELLPRMDIVALSLPATPDTYRLWNDEVFSWMKEGSFLLNVGRGNVLDPVALKKALDSGRLAGAYGDCWDPEPLPSSSPLWDEENLIITPHIAGFYHIPATLSALVEIVKTNLAAYRDKTPYKNVVDFATGYRSLS